MNEYKTFDEVAEQLKEAGFRYEDKALWAGNQRLKPNDATAMLKPFGLTLHELGKLYRQQVAGVSWEDNKKIISVISPLSLYVYATLLLPNFSCFASMLISRP